MRDDICTIPVSEVFEQRDGCPICRMYATVEEHLLDYILGDAMMEPDVRIETNKSGFCTEHFDKMLSRRGRLQLALMLETHIKSVEEGIFEKKFFNPAGKKAQKARELTGSCFICDKIEWGMSRMLETVCRCYENERDFRELFNSQPEFCLPHYERLIACLDKKKYPRYGAEMAENLTRITGEYAKSLTEDVSKYCRMYDYRSRSGEADWGNSRDSVERTVGFLTGRIL